jgi:hypothetical protein
MDVRLQEASGQWILPVDGQQITRICVDYAAVTLLLVNSVEVRVQCPFTFTNSDGHEYRLDPENDGLSLAPVLAMMRVNVRDGAAFNDGRLVLNNEDGSRICVSPNDSYEAWMVNGPKGLKVISIPGGDLAIWGPADDSPDNPK